MSKRTVIQILRWESNDIPRRADGYFNATFMCKAGGKLFGHFMENTGTAELLEALAASTGIPITELVRSIRGGIPHQQGTWVHPQVALALPQWVVCPSSGLAIRLSAITAFCKSSASAGDTQVWIGSNDDPYIVAVTPEELAILIQADGKKADHAERGEG